MQQTNTTENTVDYRATQQIQEKWGDAVGKGGMTGFVAVPEALLRGQNRLELTSTEMVVLMNILMHWWYADQKPFPRNSAIAKRMGVEVRTVQRAIEGLSKKGLIKREVNRQYDAENKIHSATRKIDLSGLVTRLCVIAEGLRDYNDARQQKQAGN